MTIITIPAPRFIFLPVSANTYVSASAAVRITVSMTADMSVTMALIEEEIPKIKSTLNIFEPMTLPTAMSFCFLRAATIDVTSSGSDVPIATTVSPTTFSLSPACSASS